MTTFIAYAIEIIDDAFGAQYHEYHGEPRQDIRAAIKDMKELDCGEECGIIVDVDGQKLTFVWGVDLLETEHLAG